MLKNIGDKIIILIIRCIRNHECGIVEVCIEKENCMELYSNYKPFGRVVLREKMNTIGVGSITKIMW